jgi:hypothetical protein
MIETGMLIVLIVGLVAFVLVNLGIRPQGDEPNPFREEIDHE